MNFSKEDWQKIEDKCLLQKIDPKLLEEKFQEALTNDYVEGFHTGRLIYSKKFYQDMHKKIESGMTYVQAYKVLGFNVDALGEDRANSAGRRAEQMAKDGTLYKAELGDYPGDIPMEDMQELKKTDPDGYLAYLEGRCLYLQASLEVEKEKKRSFYQKKYSELKKAGKIK